MLSAKPGSSSTGRLAALAKPRTFASWLSYCSARMGSSIPSLPFGGPEHVLRYLGAYTHRVAISNHRLVALVDETSPAAGETPITQQEAAHDPASPKEFLRASSAPAPARLRAHPQLRASSLPRRAELLPLCFRLLKQSDQHQHPRPAVRALHTPAVELSALRRNHACCRALSAAQTPPQISASSWAVRSMNPYPQPRFSPRARHAHWFWTAIGREGRTSFPVASASKATSSLLPKAF